MSHAAGRTRSDDDNRDPVLAVRAHLEQALPALDQLRELLPKGTQPDRRGAS